MSQSTNNLKKQMIALAVPTLGSLLTEPILTLTDSILVGHLGPTPLAGLALGATVLNFVVGACIFLAYTSTALSGQAQGRGDMTRAYLIGLQGVWLGLGLGIVFALFSPFVPRLLARLTDQAAVADQAATYLQTSAWGLPAMLAVLAANGIFRALKDTRTPLYIAIGGSLFNIPLSVLCIYFFDLGIRGAALGTIIAQAAMFCLLLWQLKRRFRVAAVPFALHPTLLRELGFSGAPLVVRSVCLQTIIFLTTYAAGLFGTTTLAAFQIVRTVWNLLAYGIDSLAIAAQILVSQAVGKKDKNALRSLISTLDRWGLGMGTCMGGGLLLLAPFVPWLFTSNPDVVWAAGAGLVAAALSQPLAALTFMYDGYLIGAADNLYLAKAMLVTLFGYAVGLGGLSCVLLGWPGAPNWISSPVGASLLIWGCYGFIAMGLRFLTLKLRTKRLFLQA